MNRHVPVLSLRCPELNPCLMMTLCCRHLQKTVDCMTTMSVPSTLVKCLYLFFDLPHMAEAPVAPTTQQQQQPLPPPPPQPTAPQEKTASQQELPLADRRVLLQKVFVQVKRQFLLGGCDGIDKFVFRKKKVFTKESKFSWLVVCCLFEMLRGAHVIEHSVQKRVNLYRFCCVLF